MKDRRHTCNLTASEIWFRFPSANKQSIERGENTHLSNLRYKYSMTSDRMHENWAPVSTRAGISPIFVFSETHNKAVNAPVETPWTAPNAPARWCADRRAPARFPIQQPFDDNCASHGPGGHNSNTFVSEGSPVYFETTWGEGAHFHKGCHPRSGSVASPLRQKLSPQT